MTRSRRSLLAFATILTFGLATASAAAPTAKGTPLSVSGPYVYENLDVYLLHGTGRPTGGRLVPLSEALARKLVVVKETGTVSQLAIENVSDETVYIQADDIVKGGRQDRVLKSDVILPPKSGRVPIASFCVEQGRWRQRGNEAADHFASSEANLAHKQLKLANRRGSQTEVWANVAEVQNKLGRNLGADVRGAQSSSSLQLTLENDRVRKGVEGYVRALSGIAASHSDARGMVVAINGELNSGEVYGTHDLFVKLWPKLLRASATEAVAEREAASAHTPPTIDAVREFLTEAEAGQASPPTANGSARSVTVESKTSVMVETRPAAAPGVWLHRSYVRK